MSLAILMYLIFSLIIISSLTLSALLAETPQNPEVLRLSPSKSTRIGNTTECRRPMFQLPLAVQTRIPNNLLFNELFSVYKLQIKMTNPTALFTRVMSELPTIVTWHLAIALFSPTIPTTTNASHNPA